LYFEREFAIRFELVANNDLLIYTDPTTDPYTKFEPQDYLTLMNQNQAVVDSTIGSANYDVGHLFFVAFPDYAVGAGRPCNDADKAKSGTGFTIQPDEFKVAIMVHELGHMFGAGHTFNGPSCAADGYSSASAYEPGSGSTIMSFASGGCDDADR